MVPRLLHLIWFGPMTSAVDDAVSHWKVAGGGRHVILHTDNSLLLPELKPVWDKHAAMPRMKSDLLRWSLLMTAGGWYFDVDVRLQSGSLDAIEEKYRLGGSECFLANLLPHTMPTNDMLAAGLDWSGAKWVTAYILAALEKSSIEWLEFSLVMLAQATMAIPDSFILGDDDDFSLAAPAPLVARQGRWKTTPASRTAFDVMASKRTICDNCHARPEGCWNALNYSCMKIMTATAQWAWQHNSCPLGKLGNQLAPLSDMPKPEPGGQRQV